MKPSLVVLIASVFAITNYACKKDSVSPIAPAPYSKTSIEKSGNLRVFAKSGEIKHTSVVSRFAGMDTSSISSLATGIFSNGYYVDSIKVLDAGSAVIRDQFSYYSCSITSNGSMSIFTHKDTTTGIIYGDLYSRSIAYIISKYKPSILDEYIHTSTGGAYGFRYRTQKQFFLAQEHGKLKAPWIFGVYHYGSIGTATLTLHNKLDNSFYKSIGDKDTIVIQEYSIIYE